MIRVTPREGPAVQVPPAVAGLPVLKAVTAWLTGSGRRGGPPGSGWPGATGNGAVPAGPGGVTSQVQVTAGGP